MDRVNKEKPLGALSFYLDTYAGSDFENVKSARDAIRSKDLEKAAAFNQAITGEHPYAQYEKSFNEVHIAQIQTGSGWTEEQLLAIYPIAQECLSTGGRASYTARKVIETYRPDWDLPACVETEDESGSQRIGNPTQPELMKLSLTIAPMPVSNLIQLKGINPEAVTNITILDIQGRKLVEFSSFGESEVQFKLPENLINGMYVLKAVQHNTLVGVQKFTVQN